MWFYSLIDSIDVKDIEYIDLTNNKIVYGNLKIKFSGNAKPLVPFDLYEIFNKSNGKIYIYKHIIYNKYVIYIDNEHKLECNSSSIIDFYIYDDLIKTLKIE